MTEQLQRKWCNAASSSSFQIKDNGANCECPNCHPIIDNSNVTDASNMSQVPETVGLDEIDDALLCKEAVDSLYEFDPIDLNQIPYPGMDDALLCKEAIDSLNEFDPIDLNQIPYPGMDDALLCKESIDSLYEFDFDPIDLNQIPIPRISELKQIDFGTPLNFLLKEFLLGSQESIFDLLNW